MNKKSEEQLRAEAQSARLLHMSEDLIFPLLNRKIEESVARLVNEFKKTGTQNLGDVAYIAACQDIKNELNSIMRRGDSSAMKLQENQPV